MLAAVETVIAALDGGPLLDDARYAGAVAGSLHRRGVSRRMSAQRLRTKGVASEQIAVAQAEVAGLGADSELVAATRYAQRRRLGPFQPDAGRRVERRLKDLAALGRQGFDYATARRVVDAEDGDALPTGDGEA